MIANKIIFFCLAYSNTQKNRKAIRNIHIVGGRKDVHKSITPIQIKIANCFISIHLSFKNSYTPPSYAII